MIEKLVFLLIAIWALICTGVITAMVACVILDGIAYHRAKRKRLKLERAQSAVAAMLRQGRNFYSRN